jgi:hypothetical protein
LTSLTTRLWSSLMLVSDRRCRLSISLPASLVVEGSTAWKLFVAGQEGGQVGGVHQVQRRALQAIIDPGQAGVSKGSANTPIN